MKVLTQSDILEKLVDFYMNTDLYIPEIEEILADEIYAARENWIEIYGDEAMDIPDNHKILEFRP